MTYKKALFSLAVASLLISSSCLAAGSNPLYSCKDVTALSKKNNQSKSNFVFHTMPNYVGDNEVWKNNVEAKFAWINKNYPEKGNLLIYYVLNSVCKSLPANYDKTEHPIEDMYLFAVNWSFKYLETR
ncbi:hypothetical protein HK18_10630 [Commensalibacter intestini]|uniref:Uncharacterized protein n=1 Tax=Commensalibacter intestini TaxID=479936 RepID=A0A251ZTK0_9PROT|nr:hypothetical protein [Commensalibacter intestini]OUI77999.1 hypothetical protein HK18_10630 [Commensalibacter intestini]